MILEDATRSELEQEVLKLWSHIGELEAKLAIAVEALESYGDRDNWTPADDEYAWRVENKISGNDLDNYVPTGLTVDFKCGGKTAREALAKIRDQK